MDFNKLRTLLAEEIAKTLNENNVKNDRDTATLIGFVLITMGVKALILQDMMPARILASCLQLLTAEMTNGEQLLSAEEAEDILGLTYDAVGAIPAKEDMN